MLAEVGKLTGADFGLSPGDANYNFAVSHDRVWSSGFASTSPTCWRCGCSASSSHPAGPPFAHLAVTPPVGEQSAVALLDHLEIGYRLHGAVIVSRTHEIGAGQDRLILKT